MFFKVKEPFSQAARYHHYLAVLYLLAPAVYPPCCPTDDPTLMKVNSLSAAKSDMRVSIRKCAGWSIVCLCGYVNDRNRRP
jgi:hypothetical protein